MCIVIFLLLLACSWDDQESARPPRGASVNAGYLHTCEVKTDGAVACWGNDEWGQATPPRGKFVSVSAGEDTPAG